MKKNYRVELDLFNVEDLVKAEKMLAKFLECFFDITTEFGEETEIKKVSKQMKPIYEDRNGPPEWFVESGEHCWSKDCQYRNENKNCSHPNPQFKKAWSSHDIFPYPECISYQRRNR